MKTHSLIVKITLGFLVMTTTACSGTGLFLLGSALQQKEQNSPQPHIEDISASRACQEILLDSVDENAILIKQSITLLRHSRTVIRRRRCDGVIVSQKREDIASPHKVIQIYADSVSHGEVSEAVGMNHTTCSRARGDFTLFYSDNKPARLRFTVDIATTPFHTKVIEGNNIFSFSFHGKCATEDCEPEVLETGYLVLDVTEDIRDFDQEGLPPMEVDVPCVD